MIARALQSFRPAPPEQRVDHWHIAPGIDVLAYSFSWLWLLIPFWFFGPKHPEDYLWYWILGNSFSTSHRHLTMPYVYFDRQVFGTQVGRFLVVPSLLLAGFLFCGLYRSWKIPAGFFDLTDALVGTMAVLLLLQWRRFDQLAKPSAPLLGALVAAPLTALAALWAWPAGIDHTSHALAFGVGLLGLTLWQAREAGSTESAFARTGTPALSALLLLGAAWSAAGTAAAVGPSERLRMVLVTGGIAAFAGAWNIWHVYMQKYGILRMYAAKSGLPREKWVPGWVDRFLVFGWLPAYLMYLPTAARPLLAEHAPTVSHWLLPILDRLDAIAVVGLPVAVAIGIASVASYFWHEYQAAGLSNPARNLMGLGTVLLALTFFFFDPFEAYVAYGFSHAVEYTVFVWAFQRRRYREPLAHRPLLGTLLAWPVVYYVGFTLLIGGAYGFLEYGQGRLYDARLTVAGTPVRSWIFYWTVWQSMAHFYFDSFLWKMRLPEVRASL
ncbi:MAG: hypothetical protein EP330_25800 [Deltaproteobacteria bacterium]|nr:MAG: hypothetical protein EP330_25800 [Deltaproteobacteria bacterium]